MPDVGRRSCSCDAPAPQSRTRQVGLSAQRSGPVRREFTSVMNAHSLAGRWSREVRSMRSARSALKSLCATRVKMTGTCAGGQ